MFFSRLTDFFVLTLCSPKKRHLAWPRVDIFSADSRSESRRHGAVCETCSLAESPVYLCTTLGRLSSDSASPRFVFWLPGLPDPEIGMFFDPWSNALQCHAGTPAAASTVSVCKLFKTGFIVGMFALDRDTLGNRESKGFRWIVLGIRAQLFEQTRATYFWGHWDILSFIRKLLVKWT